MSRTCPVCARERGRRRPMGDGRRHLHELSPGRAFRFPEAGGAVSRLVSLGPGRAEIEDPEPGEAVSFETWDGRQVSFRRNGSGRRPCAPTAEVEPLAERER